MEHFLKKCGSLRPERTQHGIIDNLPIVETLPFGEEREDKIRGWKYLVDIWKRRKSLMFNISGTEYEE